MHLHPSRQRPESTTQFGRIKCIARLVPNTMWTFTEWQLQAKPADACFMVIRIIGCRINYLVVQDAPSLWSLDRSRALAVKDREHCYSLARLHHGLMVMEVQP